MINKSSATHTLSSTRTASLPPLHYLQCILIVQRTLTLEILSQKHWFFSCRHQMLLYEYTWSKYSCLNVRKTHFPRSITWKRSDTLPIYHPSHWLCANYMSVKGCTVILSLPELHWSSQGRNARQKIMHENKVFWGKKKEAITIIYNL